MSSSADLLIILNHDDNVNQNLNFKHDYILSLKFDNNKMIILSLIVMIILFLVLILIIMLVLVLSLIVMIVLVVIMITLESRYCIRI